MIPGNFISLTLDPKPFKSPESRPYDPISQLIRGGTRIGYGNDGRDVKDYLVELFTDGLINITDTTSNQIVYTKTLVNAETISATFDNNMNVVYVDYAEEVTHELDLINALAYLKHLTTTPTPSQE